MGKQEQKPRTITPQALWGKFDCADQESEYFEYECYVPNRGPCVRNTVMGYCPILTEEEAYAKEQGSADFYGVVCRETNEEFSPHYFYFVDESDQEHPQYYAVRNRKGVVT